MHKRQGGLPLSHTRQALLDYLDEQEDYLIAIERLKKRGPRVPLEKLEEELGLDC